MVYIPATCSRFGVCLRVRAMLARSYRQPAHRFCLLADIAGREEGFPELPAG